MVTLFAATKTYQNMFIFFLVFFVLLLGLFPYLILAEDHQSSSGSSGLVPCGHKADRSDACKFSDLETLFSKVMNFLLFTVLVPLATLSIAFVGIQYVTAAGNPSKLAKAHELLQDILLGILIALAAYAIIQTIFIVLTGGGLPSLNG